MKRIPCFAHSCSRKARVVRNCLICDGMEIRSCRMHVRDASEILGRHCIDKHVRAVEQANARFRRYKRLVWTVVIAIVAATGTIVVWSCFR